jgi:hypothetical protein
MQGTVYQENSNMIDFWDSAYLNNSSHIIQIICNLQQDMDKQKKMVHEISKT